MRSFAVLLIAAVALRPVHAAPTAAEPRTPAPAFTVDLQDPDRFTAAQGTSACLDLWTKHILATHRTLIVVGSDLSAVWLKPILDLRAARPEVNVLVMASRGALGPKGEVGEMLAAAGVPVHYTTKRASTVGWPNVPPISGLLLVRDDRSVLAVTGAAAGSDTWPNAWLLESKPVGQAYADRLAILRAQLPEYLKTRDLLLSDQ